MLGPSSGLGRYCRRPSDGMVGDWAGDPVAPLDTFKPGWFATCQPKPGIPPDQACLNELLVNQIACYSGGGNTAGTSNYVLPKFNTIVNPKPVYVPPVMTGNPVTDNIRLAQAQAAYATAMSRWTGQANMSSGNNTQVQPLPVQNSSSQGNVAQSGGSATADIHNAVPVTPDLPGFMNMTVQIGSVSVPVWMLGAAAIAAFFMMGDRR